MSECPSVSVITVYYDRAHLVHDSVRSLLSQDYPNLEIVLVDDGSTDDTAAELGRYTDDPRVRLLSGSNQGFTRALKAAIATCECELIAIHGSGDISWPGRISKLAAALRDRPAAALATSYVENQDTFDGTWTVDKPTIGEPLAERIRETNTIHHGAAMFRRTMYERVGGYRELYRYAQNHDLWLRMSDIGELIVVPEVLYSRLKVAESVSLDVTKLALQYILSDLAIQAAEARAAGRPDPVDLHGPYALALRARSRRVSRRMSTLGVRWLVFQDAEKGRWLIDAAHEEFPTLRTLALRWAARLHGRAVWFDRALSTLVARRLVGHRGQGSASSAHPMLAVGSGGSRRSGEKKHPASASVAG